jgi:penicillin-binding protein 1C
MAFYYKQNNTNYIPLPPLDTNCSSKNIKSMDFISPKNNTIILPKNVDGKTNNLALKIAHNKSKITLYWYINDKYITSTKDFHEIEIPINEGVYKITVLDSEGNEMNKKITIKT